ncbi:MAG: GIY-YIG nuclease family protein [Treponema sp.]|nr:GIY-YIG nuclease family protein [Treponema sp.]MBR7080716.1 GIY-YIG nuclease family protein [Treponema sp.]
MQELELFNQEEKTMTIGEIAKFLDITEGKTEDLFYTAILNYTDLIDLKNNESLENVKICSNTSSWKKIARALSDTIYSFPDMNMEETYKDLVTQANEELKSGQTQKHISTMKNIINISHWATIASWAVLHQFAYDKQKKILETSSVEIPKEKNEEVKHCGFVYVAKQLNEKNLYKIGCTDNISKRLGTFKTGNCFVEMVASKPAQDKLYYEKWFHNYYRAKKYKNEWFLLDSEDLKELAEIFGFNFHLKQ